MKRIRQIEKCKSICGILLVAASLNSCGNFDRDYKLRFWEHCRIASEQALHKHQVKQACAMAEEAVHEAADFGKDDFRLGVSYCDLADAEKADGRYKDAEAAYLKSAEVLTAASDFSSTTLKNTTHDLAKTWFYQTQLRLSMEDLANTLAHQADLYGIQGYNKKAAASFQKAANLYRSLLGGSSWQVDDCPTGQELVQCELGLAQVQAALKNFDLASDAYKKALSDSLSSNVPEFMLRQIRDDYIKLLNDNGQQAQAQQLVADAQYADLTSQGTQAMFGNDYPTAETAYRQAYIAAQHSFFSNRRLMRALSNLQQIFERERKNTEMELTFNTASALMRTRGLRFDRDYDMMLTSEMIYCLANNKVAEACAIGKDQQIYRVNRFGFESIPAAEALAQRGMAEFLNHNMPLAEKLGDRAYKTVTSHYLTNRRAKFAIQKTADLMVALHRLDQAELLLKQFVVNDLKMDDFAQVVGHQSSLFVVYCNFQAHDRAMQLVKEVVTFLERHPDQQIAAMPYLVLIQNYCLAYNWFDVAEPITKFGQIVMRKELTAQSLQKVALDNWQNDLAKMQQHFGHPF